MKLTYLSKGDGFLYPTCHMLNLYGFRILIDSPLDLSAIAIFSPHLYNVGFEEFEIPLDLVSQNPWYKTVKALHLWEVSLIDIVLISKPMGVFGLPFLTQNPGFHAKIYMTEATAKIGQLMMEDLVTMHMEFRRFYGPENSIFPSWIKNLDTEEVQASLKKIVFGENGGDLGNWMRLYRERDATCAKNCQQFRISYYTRLSLNWKWRKLKDENFGIARLKGELLMENGRHRLVSGLDQESSDQGRPLMHWGSLAPETLLDVLLKIGIIRSIRTQHG